ncbi:chitin synthase chs-2-like [Haliotis asinina]|uniref:chitin synthase chs-2-like n=1 Tax=Haliotis asinina TaxID=109174 RepID=UPI003531E557
MFRQPYLPNGEVPGQGVDNASYADTMDDMDDMDDEDDDVSYGDNLDEDREDLEEGFTNRIELGNYTDNDIEEDKASATNNWDVFKIVPPVKGQVRTLRFWNRVHVGVRITLCIFLFLLVLGSATFSKLCFLLIAANINKGSPSDEGLGVTVKVPWLWSMLILITAPYLFIILRNTFRFIFKKQRKLQIIPFVVVMLFETLHSIGLCLFVFVVAPSFDPVMVLMLSQGVGLVPAFNKIFWTRKGDMDGKTNTHEEFASPFWRSVSVITFILQGVFIGVSTWNSYTDTSRSHVTVILLPLSLVLISLRWWDNFVQRRKSHRSQKKLHNNNNNKKSSGKERFAKPESLTDLLKLIDKNRVKIDLLASLWKIVLTCVCLVIIFGSRGQDCWDTFLFMTEKGVRCGAFIGYTNLTLVNQLSTDCGSHVPYIVASSAVVLCGIGYKMAKSACKIRSQVMCFSLPLALCTPLSYIVLFITVYSPIIKNIACDLTWIPSHNTVFELLKTYSDSHYFPIVCGGFLSILLVCAHIWVPKAQRVAATDKLFNRPLYCGAFFDTSLMMNRRSDDSINIRRSDSRKKKVYLHNTREQNKQNEQRDDPLVYICVTMWHETKVEMLQLLKSIFKMDMDQYSRAQAQEILGVHDKDFYKMEAHIIFDNAFGHEEGEDKYLVNKYVKDFVSCINQAVREVYFSIPCLDPPVKTATPYGGRLVFSLPGENKLIVHLKHKDKIRIKKRWSQVMYMYYLLSYKMILKPGNTQRTLGKTSQKTFILTLDGDVDFQPSAVQVLLDRMKKNDQVGAACGRIHPIGSGPIIWYQKFEYAMSHWLQKAAEHVIGCVLCSPGCFSMFRASALMDDNVLRKYAEEATEPRHRVQFDQGEDRWLCTLLLQQGHRIEYNAAADAKTFAPEGFKEFYNQRRRWTPSTMANILDLLQSSATARRANNDISLLYILYQGLLFVSSVLTPGTIFLIIFSAINTAYPELPLYGAMLLNLLPMVIFTILIFTAKDDIQTAYAGILSVVYALVMTIVLVGVFKQIVESNFCSMTAGFFLFVVGVFLVSALLHPQEFFNVIYGFLYFLAIPCMSMLLMFYSFGNLNVGSWGTRDSGKKVSENNLPQEKKKKQSAMQGILDRIKGSDDADSDYVFSFGNMFRCICCPRPVLRDYTTKMEILIQKMEDLESAFRHKDDRADDSNDDISTTSNDGHMPYSKMSGMFDGGMRINPGYEDDTEPVPVEYEEWGDPRWFGEEVLGEGIIEELSDEENHFWEELIEEHLKPQVLSKDEKEDVANGLTHLRNTVCTFFFLSNSLFVTLMFILESVSEYTPSLVFKLPCDTGNNGATREPVAIAFTIIFGILLLIQFICMFAHRFSTLLAIASITQFQFKSEKTIEHEREKLMLAMEEMYKGLKQVDDNQSVLSEDSVVSSHFDTFRQTPKDQLMARFLRDSKKSKIDQPRNLNSIFLSHMKKIADNQETIEEGVDESKGEVSREVKKVFPGMSNQSFFTIAEMLKNKEQMGRIKTLAADNWKKGFNHARNPKLMSIVEQANDKAKQNEETVPKVRFAESLRSILPSLSALPEDRTTSPASSTGNNRGSDTDGDSKELKVDFHSNKEDQATRTSGWQILGEMQPSGMLRALNKTSDSEDTLLEDSRDVKNHDRGSYISVTNEETVL